jgi:chorismate mutase
MCAREIPVPGAMPKVIRVLVHAYADDGHEAKHVYLGDTPALRRDLHSAQ